MWWPYWLRSITSNRADHRVQSNTFNRDATLVIAFILAVNATVCTFFRGSYAVLNEKLLGYLAGQHCIEMSNSDVRCFTSAIKFFLPWTPRERITAELRGVEKSTKTTPTTHHGRPCGIRFNQARPRIRTWNCRRLFRVTTSERNNRSNWD